MLAISVLSLTLASACRSVEPSTALPKGGGGELRVVLPDLPATLNPNLAGDEMAIAVGENIFNHLIALDADYRPIPALAESWEATADATTYTFRLRAGVRWHDGRPFTANDVRYTFSTLRDGAGTWSTLPPGLAVEVETLDQSTVRLRLDAPWAPFLPLLASPGHAILPAHIYEGTDWRTHEANLRPIGTGPFRFEEWVPGERVVLAANPQYFGRGPFLDRVVYLPAGDSERGALALLQGDADLLVGRPPAALLPRLQAHPDLVVRSQPTLSRFNLVFNLRRPPLDDRRVREALARAIDRSAIVEAALGGYGAPALGFFTPAIAWAYNGDARVPPFSPDEARRLLDEAGLRARGRQPRARLTLFAGQFSPYTELAPIVQEQLAEVGVAIDLAFLPPTAALARFLEGRFDLTLIAGTHGPDPDFLRARYGSRAGGSLIGYHNAAFDAVVDRAAREPDMAARAGAYLEAQAMLAADLPVVPIAEAIRLVVARRGLTGLHWQEARGLVPEHDYSLVRLTGIDGPASGRREAAP